jgi:hypothetical protein
MSDRRPVNRKGGQTSPEAATCQQRTLSAKKSQAHFVDDIARSLYHPGI